MKYIHLIAFYFLNLFAGFTQVKNTYTIRGTFPGLQDSTLVSLVGQYGDTIQSTRSANEDFILTGSLKPEGRFLFIKFDTNFTKIQPNPILVTNSKIEVKGNIGKKEILVHGSIAHNKYLEAIQNAKQWNAKTKPFEDSIKMLKQPLFNAFEKKDSAKVSEYQAQIEKVQQGLNSVKEDYTNYLIAWCMQNKNSLYTPYIIENAILKLDNPNLTKKDIEVSKKLYNLMSQNVKDSYYGIQLYNSLQSAESTLTLKEGSIIPNIKLLDTTGNAVMLHTVLKKNKLNLIDCWASWCSPCRDQIPKLAKTYEDYKEKGFTIIGVSSDKNKEKWQKAIIEDQAPWQQLLENEYSLLKLFQIKSIPAYILVDDNGKLIAFSSAVSGVSNFGQSLYSDEIANTIEIYLKSQFHQ